MACGLFNKNMAVLVLGCHAVESEFQGRGNHVEKSRIVYVAVNHRCTQNQDLYRCRTEKRR